MTKFREEKKMSMKHLIHLTTHEERVLLGMMSLRHKLHFTSSLFLELANHLNSLMKASKRAFDDIINNPDVQRIFRSSHSAHQRSDAFRAHIQMLKHPTLTAGNKALNEIKKKMNIHSKMDIKWDPSLEHKRVTVDMVIQEPQDIELILKNLQTPYFLKGVREMLNGL